MSRTVVVVRGPWDSKPLLCGSLKRASGRPFSLGSFHIWAAQMASQEILAQPAYHQATYKSCCPIPITQSLISNFWWIMVLLPLLDHRRPLKFVIIGMFMACILCCLANVSFTDAPVHR